MALYRKTTSLSKIYRGSTEVNKIFRGQTQVYSSAPVYPYLTDDLILSLDATDSNSYPGTGTTWTDLANNVTFTLTNGTYSSNNGGYINFNGDGWAASNSNIQVGSQSFTMEFWIRPTSATQNQYANILDFEHSGPNTVTGGFVVQQASTNQNNFYWGWYHGSGFYSDGDSTKITLSVNSWTHFVIVKDGATSYFYVNGSVQSGATWTAAASTYVDNAQPVYVGRYAHGTYRNIKADYGAVRVYAKALSSSEVSSNYTNTNSNY